LIVASPAIAHQHTDLEMALAELAHAQAKTERTLDRLSAEMREFKDEMREFKDEMREFKDEMSEYKEWSRNQIKTMNRQWGDLANKMGTLAEDLVAPSVPRILRDYVGCPESGVEFVTVRFRGRKTSGEMQEFDVLAGCGNTLLINETKTTLRPKDVDGFVAMLAQAREFIPEYAGRRIVGVLASFYIDPTLTRYGERQGLIMLGATDGIMEVLNSPEFSPREF
jgi:hypothetical protein